MIGVDFEGPVEDENRIWRSGGFWLWKTGKAAEVQKRRG
jgi:hypothetical protein